MTDEDKVADYRLAQHELVKAMNELRKLHGQSLLQELSSVYGDEACAFCGKPEGEAKALIKGLAACICDECILEAYRLLIIGKKPQP